MRRLPGSTLGVIGVLFASQAGAAVPDFVPTSGKIFEEYHAMDQPRTDVPVGALWIQNYGPTGEGATADNLDTIKSLTGIAINRDLQISLTAGLFRLFGLDPSYKNRVTARFTDVSIVRVKDMAKLAGPPEEPRIYEALKAGTITITTDNSIGLDLDAGARVRSLPVIGRADTGRNKSLTIDGQNMFIAYRVATLKSVQSKTEEVRLRSANGSAEAELFDYRIVLDTAELEKCLVERGAEQGAACEASKEVAVFVRKLDGPAAVLAGAPRITYNLATGAGQGKLLPLPVPIADRQGGLFTSIIVRLDLDYSEDKRSVPNGNGAPRLSARGSVQASLQGTSLETLRNPQAAGW